MSTIDFILFELLFKKSKKINFQQRLIWELSRAYTAKTEFNFIKELQNEKINFGFALR